MHVISRKKLKLYWQVHSEVEEQLKAWYAEAKHSSWKTPVDIKQKYRAASILPGNRVVFNIKGDNYRIVVKINYSAGIVFIRFVGTHKEYDAVDVTKI